MSDGQERAKIALIISLTILLAQGASKRREEMSLC